MIRKLAVLVVALGLTGCGGAAPQGAAESASRLLAAALKGDRVAFEAEIDRAAVRDDVRRQIADVARGSVLDVEGGPSEFALDRMISPAAIRVVHAGTGETLTAPPTPAQVAKLMREVDGRRACVRGKAGDCLLTFAREKRDWRLVGMKAMDVEIEVASR
ncbi:MAG: hypothetical protein JNL41_12215 [Phenylobacterium sp.]|uniref:hypothetical protein n=1 Tax=Phenylobacterium sp. TaxID=1871053 RepID=UPI001A3D9A0B|nr:hypothetical protein [Phenylobacterium sp.]MBL8555037.1 hypothetical protein [Phenylobacterium sp.]